MRSHFPCNTLMDLSIMHAEAPLDHDDDDSLDKNGIGSEDGSSIKVLTFLHAFHKGLSVPPDKSLI